MLRAVLLSMLLLLAAAPAVGAEIRVIDTTTGRSRTLLKGDAEDEDQTLVRRTDDRSALLADPHFSMLQIGVIDGSVQHPFDLDGS